MNIIMLMIIFSRVIYTNLKINQLITKHGQLVSELVICKYKYLLEDLCVAF